MSGTLGKGPQPEGVVCFFEPAPDCVGHDAGRLLELFAPHFDLEAMILPNETESDQDAIRDRVMGPNPSNDIADDSPSTMTVRVEAASNRVAFVARLASEPNDYARLGSQLEKFQSLIFALTELGLQSSGD
jgi:hypothetical protein